MATPRGMRSSKALAVGEDGLMASGVGPRSSKSGVASGKENLVPCAFDPDSYSSKAAALGQEGRVKARSTKGKAALSPSAVGVAKAKADAGCVFGDEPAGAAAAAVTGGEGASAGTGLWILPDEEVQYVLSRKREPRPPGLVGFDAFDFLGDSFDKYQDWMRRNYEANGGVVLVDDDFVARREEHYQWVEEKLAREEELGDPLEGLDFAYWNISDRLSDFCESDDDGEEDAQEPKAN